MKRRTNATNITPPRAKRSMAPAQDLDQNIVALAEQERHRTLVLLGLPESAAALPSERVQEDRKVATKILDHLDVEAEPTAVVAMNCCCLYIIFALCIFFISHLRSADFGRDLSSVQLLPNKLDTFDNGLNTSERWDQLKAALIEKRSKLGESQTLQQFSRDADEVENWIAEKFQVAQEETSAEKVESGEGDKRCGVETLDFRVEKRFLNFWQKPGLHEQIRTSEMETWTFS
ncbi:hypothetical protein niasHT_011751 [Heterodera trifolii]|uniref:Uncharacterized protein n=1 Tax=Heterodera trifolii TaxID=157864 RepID=A0ABD2LGL1_9BILA